MYLKVPAAVYFDDYPMFSPESSAHEADMLVSDFLDLWGGIMIGQDPRAKPLRHPSMS